MLERNFVEKIGNAVDDYLKVTTDATGSYSVTLKAYQRNVEVDSTLGVGTVCLPPVTAAKGQFYGITALVGNTNAVTVAPYATNDAHDWDGNYSLNAALDRVLLFSDGRRWWKICDMFT